MKHIQTLWEEFQRMTYPEEGYIEGLDLELMDTTIAGCIQSFISNNGSLEDEKKNILKDCMKDLKIHRSKIPETANDYFTKLYTLGEQVLKACMIRLFTDVKIDDKEKFDRKTHHWSGGLNHQELMSLPELLIIIEDIKRTSGFYLYRYTESGMFCGDTWHQNLDDAKYQVNFEYGGAVGEWKPIPDNHVPLEYVLSKIKLKNYKKHYKELNAILNEWDFLGVVDEDNQDEYSDLINPILSGLEKGMNQKKLSEFIVNFVTETYGTTPTGSYEASGNIIKWWSRK